MGYRDWLEDVAFEISVLGATLPARLCASCSQVRRDVVDCPSMTRYPHDSGGIDPNADIPLCVDCAHDYLASMESEWDEYYAGLL